MKAVLLFDGECNVCDATVNFIIDRDATGDIAFASQQSEIGGRIMDEFNQAKDLSTVILIKDNQASTKSTAMLYVLGMLGFPWNMFTLFLIIPAFIRDFFYKLFAWNRIRLFGKKDACKLPTKDIRRRFLKSSFDISTLHNNKDA